jgi:hypothetical protein
MKKLKKLFYPKIIALKLRHILILAGLIILSGLLLLQYESWRTVRYIIPPGVDAGRVSLDLPNEVILTVGVKDTLVIENQDNAIHTFGPFVIGPESTFSERFSTPRRYEAICTFHPDKQMSLVIRPAPWSSAFWNQPTLTE